MSVNVAPYVGFLHDLAASSGLFETVLDHEPKGAPAGNELTACIIGSSIVGVESSGLDSLSARVEFRVRILTGMLTEPQDIIDTLLMNAAGEYFGALVGAFTAGGLARAIDLLGADGEPLRATLGYMQIGGGPQAGSSQIFRVADVQVPIVINDCWTMEA